jgi:hypothetical protein
MYRLAAYPKFPAHPKQKYHAVKVLHAIMPNYSDFETANRIS